MGLIQIRERNERLGGLPGVRMADTRTGAADALMGISRARQASRAADAGIVSTIGNVAQGAARIAAKFLEERDRDEADAAAQAYMREKRAEYFGTTDEGGNFVPGRLQRNMDDPGSYVADAQDYDKDLAERHFGKLSANARKMAERAVAGLDLQTQDAVVGRATKEWQGRRVAAADEGLRQHTQNVLDLPDVADAGVRAAAWGGWNDQVERTLDVRGVTDPAARREFRRKNALALAEAALDRRLAKAAEETDGAEPDAVPDAFDGIEGAVKENGWRGVLDGAVKNEKGEVAADWLAEDMKGVDEDEVRRAMAKKVEAAKGRAMDRAAAAERRQAGEIAAASANAIANGGADELEKAYKEMKSRAEGARKGSAVETVALREAKRLDAAADAEAKRVVWDGLVDAAATGIKYEPPKEGRKAKFYKALKESFDRQAQAYMAEVMLSEASAVQEERKANYAALRASMLEAAAVDPGGFSARLAEAAEKGHVTLNQYQKLRDEFRDVWTKEGMPQKGAALVQILKNEFYADKDYDLSDRLAVNPKTGKFEYVKDPDTKKPFEGEDVELEAQVLVPYDPHDWFGLKDFLGMNRATHYETTTRTFTSDEQLKMLDWAMELAQHDGEWISTDPQTGAKLDKPRKLDAAAELQDACSRLRTSKRAEASQDLVLERATAMLNLRAGFAQADDAVTGAAAKREAVELKTRESLKSAKRKPFAPKMPGGSRGEGAASEGGEE